MNAVEIEEAICELVDQPFDAGEFPYAFLEAFGNPEPTIKRLRKGDTNRTDVEGAILQRSNIHILVAQSGEVESGLKALRESPKTVQQKAKFILVTDGDELQAEDLKSGDVLACQFVDLPKHFGFLLPLAGISTVEEIKNNPIDIKATGRLDKLYVALLEKNPEWAKQENREDFNHFMAQLIFCFFAEDTGIFNGEGLFTSTVRQMSDSDGSNAHDVISAIFEAMNLDPRIEGKRKGVRPYADGFPYVNGGLFSGDVKVPVFSRIARTYLLRAGELDWTTINPDIFGSMIQAVADDEERGELGMHYTSVPNILKVLNPLFLDSLNEDLEKAGNNKQQLGKLKKRLAHIRVFDPACGSGNFLVIAYKRMREIEHKANIAGGWAEQIGDVDGAPRWVGQKSVIPLTNFRGIEIKSFAAEIARLALIVAEYQADELYLGQREALALFLPLEKQNWIVCENAVRVDWLKSCPLPGEMKVDIKFTENDLFETPKEQSEINFENVGGEVYVCGNPPFAGQKNKSDAQRSDMNFVMDGIIKSYGSLDYVTAFYLKLSNYIAASANAKGALVATNSVVQGRHIAIFWPHIFGRGCRINFAHRSFLWANSAKKNASVYCVIVGLGKSGTTSSYIYDGGTRIKANGITAYLTQGETTFVQKRKTPLSPDLQLMRSGNMPLDNGNLLLSNEEKIELVSDFPASAKFVQRVFGAKELNQGLVRYCLWIEDDELNNAMRIQPIRERLENCAAFRKSSSAPELANSSHRFRDTHRHHSHAIFLPNLSSEVRDYRVPVLVKDCAVASNLALAIYDGAPFQIAILASRIHHLWAEITCGKFKKDFRYSNDLAWHTFPIPKLSKAQIDALTYSAISLMTAIEANFPKTLNELYNHRDDMNVMPQNLRAAHDENDRILEEIYIGRRFKNDTERLEKLFEMYTEMTNNKTNQ